MPFNNIERKKHEEVINRLFNKNELSKKPAAI